jgi:hypothetical protein
VKQVKASNGILGILTNEAWNMKTVQKEYTAACELKARETSRLMDCAATRKLLYNLILSQKTQKTTIELNEFVYDLRKARQSQMWIIPPELKDRLYELAQHSAPDLILAAKKTGRKRTAKPTPTVEDDADLKLAIGQVTVRNLSEFRESDHPTRLTTELAYQF